MCIESIETKIKQEMIDGNRKTKHTVDTHTGKEKS
jgi:hypothetical protein